MKQRKASDTAMITAVQRAAHQVLDASPRILNDPVSVGLTPGSSESELRDHSSEYQRHFLKLTRSGIVLRSRFAEDHLHDSIQAGVRQYLMLGAGFDTFAFRQKDGPAGLNIVEVDHPATQAVKLQYLREAGLAFPANLSFCPIDFQRVSLAEGLAHSEFDPNRPTLVSLLGVTMYLTRAAIEETFKFVLTLPPASRFVFTFFQPPESTENEDIREQTEISMRIAAEHGEPMISLFTRRELTVWLRELGFSHVEHFTADQADERYINGRTDGLTAYTSGQNICAFI